MWVQLAGAFLGAMGFAVLYHLRGVRLLLAALGGMLSWGVYLWAEQLGAAVLVRNLAAACFSATYAEVLARILKTPATVFVIPAVIPQVPGGSLYHAMYSAVTADSAALARYGYETWNAALGIAVGIAVVTSLFRLMTTVRLRRRKS